MAISVNEITPNSPYSSNENSLLNASVIDVVFNPSINYIEYVITDANESFKLVDENYNRYSFPTDGTVTSNNISSIIFDPGSDIQTKNLNVGNYIVYYNFYQNEVNTSPTTNNFFIKEISPDRTEITVSFTALFTSLESVVSSLKVDNGNYFKEFYLNFGGGDAILANNVQVNSNNTLLIFNLYQPLPDNIETNALFWIVTKIADTLSFRINITSDPYIPTFSSVNIKGPNFNLPIKDRTNNTTGYLDYNTLLQIQSVSSSNQIKSLLAEKGIDINIDYTDFNNFIHFSSVYQRLTNFYYKVSQIESYNNDISSLSSVTNSSSSISILQSKITNIVENFDDYEYYLYYSSGSWAWPKSNSTLPYTLYSTGSSEVINWLGDADNLTGILGSASIYDENNQNNLYYSIPEYIRDDVRNEPYYLFIEMIGQHYDSIWTYYKDVTNLHVADNRLDYGISKDLVAEALKSFGIKIYQNNFTTQDLYSAFLGYTSNNIDTTGSLPVNTGSFQEYINNYITASYDASVMPLDDYNKEVYKRIYHNLPYLAKTKGTIPGLRALINCFGVPDTILRISEFGGRDKDTSTYDYFNQQYNYTFYVSKSFQYANFPLKINDLWGTTLNNPESIQFRFKTQPLPTSSAAITSNQFYRTASVLLFHNSSSNNYINPIPTASLLALEYSGSFYATGAYKGSTYSSSYQYANLVFYPNIRDTASNTSISLPFYNNDWWSVMLNITGSTFTLYAGNKLYYDGYDGNQIGFLKSSSITYNINDTAFKENGSYSNSGSIMMGAPTILPLGPIPLSSQGSSANILSSGYPLSRQLVKGQYQELRYWAKTGSVESFKDFIMNPSSIDYWGDENEYANYLAYRIPLGNELRGVLNTTGTDQIFYTRYSVHPKSTGSWAITSSFNFNEVDNLSGTSFPVFYPNIEPFFYNQPIAGIRNRVTDKIQIVNSIYPTGSVLSQYRSLEQNFPISGSETPDINLLEIAFSPQNEINDDIISSLGYFNIGEYIGDPRQTTSRDVTYPDLVNLSNGFFQKYFASYDLFDYMRLIKYFDNSLFKMIQDFVPARTSLSSGIVVKQHLLERNRYPQPLAEWEDLDYSGSITTAFISGSTGGTFNQYNILTDYQNYPFIISGSGFIVDPETPINYFVESSSFSTITVDNSINTNFAWDWTTGELITYFYGNIKLFASGTNSPLGNTFNLYFSSSQNGVIASSTQGSNFLYITPLTSCSYGERFSLWIEDGGSGPNTISVQFGLHDVYPYSNQTWVQHYTNPTGVSTIIHSTQDEFYNGELPYSNIIVDNGELNEANPFKEQNLTLINYNTYLYKNNTQFPNNINYDITNLNTFLDSNTVPNTGEIYLWYDDSTYNIGAPPISGIQYNWDTYSSRFSTEKVKYIKINNIDLNGANNFTNLSQLQTLTLSFPDGNFEYPIYSIQENDGYFLYSIGPYLPVGPFEQIGNPNTSSLGGVLDYSTVATQSSFTFPSSTYTLLTASLTASSGNSLGYFNDNTSTYTLGNTPNTAITFKLSATASVSSPPGGEARIYLLSTRNIPGSFTVTAPLSSPEYVYYPLLLQVSDLSSGEASVTFYGTSSLIDGDRFRVAVLTSLGEGITLTNLTLTISQSILNFTPSQSLSIYSPYLPPGVFSFDYNDYNPLIDNAEESRTSNIFMDIDYSQNPITPINQSLIVIGGADRAPVQDSNYASKAWSNIRYNGSRYNSIIIKTRTIVGNNITQRNNPFGG